MPQSRTPLGEETRENLKTTSDLAASRQRLLAQQAALAALTKSQVFGGENLWETFALLTETAARLLSIERVSLWRYTEDHAAIRCIDLYELSHNRHSAGNELDAAHYPTYFQALATSEAIVADDARADPRTCEFSSTYLTPLGITAMMDIPILLGGQLEGVLCCEQVDPPARWQPEGRLFGIAVANLIALAIEQGERRWARAALQDSEARMRAILNAATDAIITIDHEGRIVQFNPAAERTFGYRREDTIGQPMAERLIPPALREAHRVGLQRYLATGEGPVLDRTIEMQALRADGTEFPVELTVTRIALDGPPLFTAYLRDITERKSAEARIQHLAYHDPLTGLPNRNLLMDRLDHDLAQASRNDRKLAVLFVDLDRFKTINDTLGHAVGDVLLDHVGARLKETLREGDTIGRLGGDEFVIVLPSVLLARDAAQVATKAIRVLSAPFSIAGHELHVTASIGIGVYPGDGEDRDTLIKHADVALYQAKDRGRNNYQFFSRDMNRQSHERLILENALRRAIERSELELHYQPQVALASGAITGVEALVCWRHPKRGMVPPAQFIPIAEETGLIAPISEWVLRSACAQCRAWQKMGLPRFRVAVNLSARQLRRADLLTVICWVLKETQLDPAYLELEITESSVMHEPEEAIRTLQELNAIGVQLAMDDFGTGCSSLGSLKRLPLDRLKIDSSFVRDIPADADDVAIVQAILALAHQLGLGVVAEGVERQEQWRFLKERRCPEIQGNLVSPPRPAAAIPTLFNQTQGSSELIG
jgi:diguanylate cyclase